MVLISLSQAIEPYHRDCYACPVIRRTYGYIPGRRALSLFFGRYSFSVPLRVGSYFGLSIRLCTETSYPLTVIYRSTTGLDVEQLC